MTEQDENAVTGKAVRERAEASKTVAMLRARLQEIGQQYRKVAESLQNEPEGLVATEEAMDSRFAYKIVSIQLGSWVEIKDILLNTSIKRSHHPRIRLKLGQHPKGEVELHDMAYRCSTSSDGGTRNGLKTVGRVCAARWKERRP